MKNTKKSFKRFSEGSKKRERARRELLKIAEDINVGTRGAVVRFTDEGRARSAGRKRQIIAQGVFSETSSGYGFVNIGEGERDIFIPESECRDAVGGDTVKISYHTYTSQDGEERTEGRILEILEYAKKLVIGTVDNDVVRMHKRRINRLFIITDDGKIKRKIYLLDDGGAKRGDKVAAKLIRGASYAHSLEANVVENFGDTYSKEANYAAILAECGIDTAFTEDELRQAKKASLTPIEHEGRVVRDEVIFTIDSESAKDLDDAISIKILDTGYELGVHIADVSVYIEEKSALDRLVMARGTSVYFTDKVVPMLPKDLSNGACSLHPGGEKYTLSAIITLNQAGEITDTRIEPSVIKSRVKGIYSEINRIYAGEADEKLLEKYAECLDSLEKMHKLYTILAKKSKLRGAVELESSEAQIILNDKGEPTDIVKRERGDAERMIEQFMLTANEAVATLLKEKEIPCVYRVHEPPPADKLSEFIRYAHNLGFDTSYINAEKCAPRDLARLIEEASERGIGEAVSYACLRSMSKAAYSDINRAHFGLGIEKYCHFTSPIRRLSDLATHRIIHKVLFEQKPAQRYKSYAKRAAAAATDGELRAVNAERRIDNLYKVIYMSDRIGESYPAMITSVAPFGIFATLENTCEGLIPLSTIEGNYVFDEQNLSVRSSKNVFRIGDVITVRVEEADILRGKLRFSLLQGDLLK